MEVPRMRFEEARRLTQRLQFIEEATGQFWKKWMQQVFSGRMLNHKWTKSVRNVAIGDIVYLAEAENDDPPTGWDRWSRPALERMGACAP